MAFASKPQDKSSIHMKSRNAGKDLKMTCDVCGCNMECFGTQQWTGGPSEKQLTHNQHNIDERVQILEYTACLSSISIKNALQEGGSTSNYTCHFGTCFMTIRSSDGYDNQSILASPTVSDVNSTGQGEIIDGVMTTGLLVGVYVSFGLLAALILAIIIIGLKCYCKRQKKERKTEEGNENCLPQCDNGSSV